MSGSLNSKHNVNRIFDDLIGLLTFSCCIIAEPQNDSLQFMVEKSGDWLPPIGHTLPVLLVRDPKDPSRHSEVVRSFWVTVGSSCSKPAF